MGTDHSGKWLQIGCGVKAIRGFGKPGTKGRCLVLAGPLGAKAVWTLAPKAAQPDPDFFFLVPVNCLFWKSLYISLIILTGGRAGRLSHLLPSTVALIVLIAAAETAFSLTCTGRNHQGNKPTARWFYSWEGFLSRNCPPMAPCWCLEIFRIPSDLGFKVSNWKCQLLFKSHIQSLTTGLEFSVSFWMSL